jgi:cellulose synthase/poly-beta-1,6-N-acetylglucosamine synthase-like glycosyltransferase
MPVSLDWQKTNSDGKPYVDTTDSGPWGYILRMLQVFEVEAQNVVSRAVSSVSGFMHVLSGPGALYRFDVLYAVRKEIFDFLYKPEAECSGVEKNLQRGEDRVFSIMVVFSRQAKLLGDTFRTHWVPKAIHYWSVETLPKKLIAQRERWINAAVAFHIWMLKLWEIITGSHHSLTRRVWALLLLELGYIGLVTLALGPGITGGLVWTLTYHILAAEPSDVASSGSGFVLDTVDELECQICEAIPGSVATDAWCMADCGDSIVRHPDICRCI